MDREKLSISGETNIGAGRVKNEDDYCIFNPPGIPAALAVLCDGIGGHRDGEVASMYTCRRMMTEFLRRGGELAAGADAGRFLVDALSDVNGRIFRRNEFDCRKLPMGCTAVAVLFTETELAFCSVGDSRLYEFSPRTGVLKQLSVDDVCPGGHALKRAVGIRRRIELEPRILQPAEDTIYILCSDGLHHFVDDAAIAGALRESATSRMAVNKLMRKALLNGATDNVTVVAAWRR